MPRFKDGEADNSQPPGYISVPIEQLSDEVLINAIAGGAVWAMEPLYQRYNRILYSLAYRMVADHQIAEDLLQDAFLAVWRRATSYSPQSGAVRSWLVSIYAIPHCQDKNRPTLRMNSAIQDKVKL